MQPSRLLASLALVLALAAVARAEERFNLKDGDRVVFYGDSITEQALYTGYAETYALTRHPKLDARFTNSGWSSDSVRGGFGGKIDVRLERDVIAHKPTVVTVMLGMNDGHTKPLSDATLEKYTKGLEHIVEKIKSALPGVRITLIEPSPYDEVTFPPLFANGGYNGVLKRFGDVVRDIAKREHLLAADLNTPVVAALEKAKKENLEVARNIIPKRVHPGRGGHVVMAAALLEAWGATPLVASVEIDAARVSVVRSEKTKVSELKADAGTLAWSQLDEALPFPLELKNDAFALAVRSSRVVELLDQEPLKVRGLGAASYALKIDGQEVGRFTPKELEQGVNLALLATPMSEQAAKVHELTKKHNRFHYSAWRTYEVPKDGERPAGAERKIASLEKSEEEAVREQREAAQPKPRRYELAPAPASSRTSGIVKPLAGEHR